MLPKSILVILLLATGGAVAPRAPSAVTKTSTTNNPPQQMALTRSELEEKRKKFTEIIKKPLEAHLKLLDEAKESVPKRTPSPPAIRRVSTDPYLYPESDPSTTALRQSIGAMMLDQEHRRRDSSQRQFPSHQPYYNPNYNNYPTPESMSSAMSTSSVSGRSTPSIRAQKSRMVTFANDGPRPPNGRRSSTVSHPNPSSNPSQQDQVIVPKTSSMQRPPSRSALKTGHRPDAPGRSQSFQNQPPTVAPRLSNQLRDKLIRYRAELLIILSYQHTVNYQIRKGVMITELIDLYEFIIMDDGLKHAFEGLMKQLNEKWLSVYRALHLINLRYLFKYLQSSLDTIQRLNGGNDEVAFVTANGSLQRMSIDKTKKLFDKLIKVLDIRVDMQFLDKPDDVMPVFPSTDVKPTNPKQIPKFLINAYEVDVKTKALGKDEEGEGKIKIYLYNAKV